VTPSRRGLIVAVGPGKRNEYGQRKPLAVTAGQIITFGRYTDYDDGMHLIVQEADIVGVETE
jgi:co-chaperonin GroES (HSP10)